MSSRVVHADESKEAEATAAKLKPVMTMIDTTDGKARHNEDDWRV